MSQGQLQVLADRVERLLRGKQRVLVALDGRCASGKTTLAGEAARRLGWAVVHLDDFFLRPEQRTAQRLAMPGENVDWERFRAQVLEPLSRGEPVCYRPYSCRTGQLGQPVSLPDSRVVLAEGAYSCHPQLWRFYDLHAFLDISPQEQMRRILVRNGPEGARSFREKWIPLEEAYFSAFHLPDRCEVYLPDRAGEAVDKEISGGKNA